MYFCLAVHSFYQLVAVSAVKLIRNNDFQYISTDAEGIHSCLIAQCTPEYTVISENNSESI